MTTKIAQAFLAVVDEFRAEVEKRNFKRDTAAEYLLSEVIATHAANHDDAVYLRDFIARKDAAAVAFVVELGEAFAKALRGMLTAEQWAEMRRRNVDNPGDFACASHDFCDANMAMIEAWSQVTGREMFEEEWHEAVCMDATNAAWSYAKPKHLTEGVPA